MSYKFIGSVEGIAVNHLSILAHPAEQGAVRTSLGDWWRKDALLKFQSSVGATPRPLLGLRTLSQPSTLSDWTTTQLMAGDISWFSWFAQHRGDWTTFEMQTLFKCVLRSYSKPRFGGCGAKGSSESECWDPGPRRRGMLLFCVCCLQCSSWPVLCSNPSWYSTQSTPSHAHSLSACPHRQFLVCSLVVGFICTAWSTESCILFRRWWGLWWGASSWKGNFTSQTRSQKKKHISPLHLVYFVWLTLSYCCSSSWGLLFSKK